tara:strand:- start:1028 stop:1417 length:390 start_codon:yes stop_codon:yes gene_type:complete
MKQFSLFKNKNSDDGKYTKKVEIPHYQPKNKKPNILELYDKSQSNKLISKIKKASISDEEKMFLMFATYRHLIFNYEKIADYYSHSSKEMQELMEDSALVIIDFEKAISKGYVKLCTEIKKEYLQEYEE